MAVSTQEREKHRKVERRSEQRWFERWQGIAGAVLGAMATVAAALLPILLGGSSGARAVASSSAVSATPMCLDAGSAPRRDKSVVTLWKCEAGNTNQAWVTDGAQVKVKDTLS